MKKLYIIIFINIFIIVYQINAQINTIEIYGAKSNGLGQITSVHNDINSSYGNQAGLAFIKGMNINLGYENRYQVFELSALNFAIAKNINNLGTFGFVIKKFGFSQFNEFMAGIAYAKKLGNSFSLGLQFDYFNTSISGYGNRSTFSFETGIMYVISNQLTIGVHVTNPFPIKFIDNQDIPTIINLGTKYKISDYLNIYAEFEKHINFNFYLKSGIEYAPINIFTLYLGFRNDFQGSADYSLGFKYLFNEKINIELSTLYNLTLGLSPTVGFNYNL
jgi:hypothetical protein